MEKFSKKKKKLIKVFLCILVICIALLFIIYYSLPFIIETIIFPRIADNLGLKNASLEVNKADCRGLGITSLIIGDKYNKGIKVDNLNISTEDHGISSVKIDGLNLFLKLENGKLRIPGIKSTKSNVKSGGTNIYSIPPFISKNFSLSLINSRLKLLINRNGKTHTLNVPFTIKLKRKGEDIIFSTTAEKFNYINKNIKLSVPEFEVNGRIIPEKEHLIFSGIANFANISLKTGNIKVQKIQGKIPFYSTISENGISFSVSGSQWHKKGKLSVGNILIGKKSFGNADFSVLQKEKSFVIKGSYKDLIKDKAFVISGKITPPEARKAIAADFIISFAGKNLDIELAEFFPKAGSANFKGDIGFCVNAEFQNNIFSANSNIKIDRGSLIDRDKDLTIKDIHLEFELEDALKLKSKPSQILTFSSLKFKTFYFENGKFSFQTESLRRYLIEKSEFKWSRGHVSSNAFWISSDKPEDIDLVLYCDRLNVADLLNQFNVGKASGAGTVSGKIPLVYKNKRILIDDGFLYSTPGIGGNISLTDFMGPLANLPKGIGTEIATEALKDFNYNWLRIKLNSEMEELLLILELDGKPAPEFLPFTMDLSNGILKKSTDSNLRAKFKGISFDINFRLPANQMLDYGTKWQTISGKIK